MGLVQYDSSDEDEDVQVAESEHLPPPAKAVIPHNKDAAELPSAPIPEPPVQSAQQPLEPSTLGPIQGPALGPSLGPSPPDLGAVPPTDPEVDLSFLTSQPDAATDADPPRSPYSAARALSRDLTLPAVPNMDIPGSPELNPSDKASVAAINAKFDTFLQLKRRTASPAHFNARLAASTALRNPALMDKLLGFVGIEHDFSEGDGGATAQYATTLGTDVWDPHGFPAWAYRGALRRAQEKGARERERGRGEAVEFVSAGTGPGTATTTTEAGSAPVRGQRRTMFDT